MKNVSLGPKDPAEIKVLRFPFLRELGEATIATVDDVTVTTYQGVDGNPTAVQLGLPVVDGTDVLVRMQAGLAGCAYKWRVVVTDSNGNRHVMPDLVRVVDL